jgi:hypothetical protein
MRTGTICLLWFVLCVSQGSAQAPGTQPKPGAPLENPRIDPPDEIKATGCIDKERDGFVLRNAAVEITPWLAPTVRHDAAGTPKPMLSRTVFALLNSQGLETHVGHRVEITGVVAPATANVPPNPDTIAPVRGLPGVPQPTVVGSGALPRLSHPSLDNKSVRMIAVTCS